MPMYQPCSRRREGSMKLDEQGQVLDLETAVKDGILDGGGEIVCGGGVVDKVDLSKMIEELDSIDIPSVFICPISLEPMQDPVTLRTGQTYERSNILKWFSMGHFTCPTTMQELWDDTVTPNITLYQLIYSWFSQKYVAMKKRSEDVQGRVLEMLETLKKVKGQARVQALKELRMVVAKHSGAQNTVTGNGGVVLVCSLLGPFTSHAVGCEVIGILVNLDIDDVTKRDLLQPAKVSIMVDILNEGSVETKINCTTLIRTLIEGVDGRSESVSSLSLLVGLLRLVKDKRHTDVTLAGLRLLKVVCGNESVKNSLVSIGAVSQLIETVPCLNKEGLELTLTILEDLSNLPEGKLALKDCPKTIPCLVKLLMKVSESCTQLALSILSAICDLAPEEYGSLAVEAGLAPKLLLVIQSGCSSELKQKSAKLLKLCSHNYTTTLFMSKCRLTRTIQ